MSSPNEPQGSHFYLIVIQTPRHNGYKATSRHGTLTPEPGATRHDLLEIVMADTIRKVPSAAEGAVTAFDVQPNQI